MSTAPLLPETETIPRLEPGDCLTRDEFERRYHAMPDCKKAELIEGIVYMPSPARFELHGAPHSHLMGCLFVYESMTPGVRSADNATNRLDLENEPQPDCMLLIDPRCGGNVRISRDDYIEGAPELVAEVSTSSVSYDRGPKLRMYRRHGVREYLIWRVLDAVFEWNVLRNGEYEPLAENKEGVLCSEAFPGLWLHPEALLRGDLKQVLETLQQGIANDAHQEFVQQLEQRRQN